MSTTIGGVRIVDMPDLGAVNDASSLVGERAGSGRFSASALRAYVGSYVNVKSYGAKGDGVTDDTAAVQAALAAVSGSGGSLFFPAGKYPLAANIPVTLGATATIGLFGAGQDITQLMWAGGGGLTINLPGETNAVHIRDMTFATGSNGVGTGLTLHLTIASVPWPNSPQSDISNVTFCGTDGLMVVHYWGTCLSVQELTQVAFTNVLFAGHTNGGGYTTTGFGLGLVATAAVPGVAYTLDNCTFNNIGNGLSYGNWIQGVVLINCNFTGCNFGINAPAATGEAMLSLANCQFNCITAIELFNAIFQVMVTTSLFIVPPAGTAIATGGEAQLTIIGNSFGPVAVGDATGKGIVVAAGPQLGGTIVGNSFYSLPETCIQFASGSGAVLVGSNTFVSCPIPITDAGTGNVIVNNLGIPPHGIAPSPGASPWTYTTTARPENFSLSATTGIASVTMGGANILAGAVAANVNASVYVPPNTAIVVTYTGTLTARALQL